MKEETKEITLQYYFSHFLLRNLMFVDRKNFSKNVGLNADSLHDFLEYFWTETKKQKGLKNTDIKPEFELSLAKMDNDVSLVIIKMPEPKELGEAFYVVFSAEENLRYFTLDKFQSPTDKRPMNLLCEWTPNKKDNFDMIGYGEIDNTRSSYLAGVIEQICTKKGAFADIKLTKKGTDAKSTPTEK